MPDLNDVVTGCIRVIAPPTNGAPLWARKAWVGHVLPCFQYIGYLCDDEFKLWVEEGDGNAERGVIVPQDQAVAILEPHDPNAAKWWRNLGLPMNFFFFFVEGEFEILSGVSEPPMSIFDEMDADYEHHVH